MTLTAEFTLAHQFQVFGPCNIPPDAPQAQWDDMERAFYAGALVVFMMLTKASDMARVDDMANGMEGRPEVFYEVFDSIHEEALTFGMRALHAAGMWGNLQ
jgi:hypothetical protein